MESIIQQAKARRQQMGLTLRDLSDLSGLGINLLSRFERGSGGISLRNLSVLLGILGLELAVHPKRRAE